ncbi:potassium-transporting ATPase subunit KdpB [Serratia marcescens]|uniref:potassium-transporting ATPase subunit KdpB n=1 Tax=Serratia marcescens TaxID=615 RepID=UPI000F7D8717|nr:K(+)-transporting ATPase subunit B [Serratia marcescens]RTF59753.1 K(+)-transporting ATPase subunit B [Serratia marcescens]RTF68098.1 K(+)-transporting ATPase subunit B [Serratia marcescens]RTG25214.1 K(+)-transporting ATPase subunit B [Serratia marcescens]RTG64525.1 K(+)-transporting ATPase subunit B [Serratia marcescens]
MTRKQRALFEPALVRTALIDAVKKLDPRVQWRNPVMFVVYIGSLLTTAIWLAMLTGQTDGAAAFTGSVSLWLWFTVLFANFAEALAEGRSKAQAESLKGTKKTSWAKKLAGPRRDGATEKVAAESLRKGDIVLVEAGDTIPCDGEVLEGGASVDESAITGESAPVIRESGGDFSSVTGGTRVLSDWLVVQCSVNPGETFLDRMIAMVEGAKRRKTPNEIALTILLVALTIVFVLATATLFPFSQYSVEAAGSGSVVTITVLVALLVCLIPTTIGGLLSAIGVAGMSRMLGANVIATSGRAVEAAGDVDVLLLDKTGTITLGNRQASEFLPAPGVKEQELADAAQLASLADETPEGRSIVVLAKQRFNLRERDLQALNATFVPFSAQTRMSGVNVQERMIRKGAVDAIRRHVESNQGHFPRAVDDLVESVARTGGTPLVVAEGARVLGVVALKDIVKGGIKERFNELRKMGIKTVMITGDNPLTAAAIAAEAGVDDFLSEATPEAKLALIRQYQAEGRLVAMTGDGTNDAPALAQADVGIAMGGGSDIAIETAAITLMRHSLHGVADAVELSKATLRNMKQNLFGAFIYNTLGIPIAAGVLYPLTGTLLSPVVAGAAMALSSITVVSNANRLLRFKPQK